MTDVFVSYKAEDRERVKPLVDALATEGLEVWWDLGIAGGASWRQTIQGHLDAAACVVVAWSAASAGAGGYFVQDEAAHARRRGVYLPIAIETVEPPLGFGQEHILKLTDWRGDRRDPQFLDLLAAVRAMVAAEPKPRPTARERALGRRSKGRWRVLAAAALLAIVGGLAIWRAPAVLSSTGRIAPRNSIAVLPLTNLSGDPAQEYFADGLSEELIAALARLSELQVIGRTSSFRFKGSREGATVIGAKLGVAYLLDGAVRRDGERVRVSAQLADTRTGFERWSETYDRDIKDIFAVQSGIAEAVAQALKVRLIGGDIAALSRGGTSDPKAYDAYLRARALLQNSTGEADDRRALAGYDKAIAADPDFARAHAGRAVALLTIAGSYLAGRGMRQANQVALASARRAVALAPNFAAVRVVLADALLNANLDVPAARLAFAEAMKTGAGEPNVLIRNGIFRCQVGDCAEGVADLRRGTALDPLNPIAYSNLGRGLIGARRYAEAIRALRRALELSPSTQEAHAGIGDCLLLQGKLAEAQREYDREPLTWARLAGRAIVLARLGDQSGARAALAALSADPSSAYQEAQVQAQWRDTNAAFSALDAGIQANDVGVLNLRVDPLMDPLRRDPRFAARLATLDLVARPSDETLR